MGKHDMPSLQMVVQGLHLVPAGPYEQEVISTYQQGAVLTVDMHQKRTLPLLKKYWAVLRDVVANCKTPWNSPDEASDALKLALGVTDIGKTVSGQWFIRAGSISFTSMDQAAFKDFFDKAMAVLAEVTGIDPETLSSRYRHLAEQEPSEAAPPADDVGSDGDAPHPSTTDVAADPVPAAADPEAGAIEAGHVDTAAPASDLTSLKREAIDKFIAAATDPSVPNAKDRQETVVFAKDAWKLSLPTELEFVKACFETANKVVKSELPAAAARRYLEGLV